MTFFTEWNVFHRKNFLPWMTFFLQNEIFFAETNFFVQNEFFSHNDSILKGIRIFFLHINNFIWKIYIYIMTENLVFVKSIHAFFLKYNYFSNSFATFVQPYMGIQFFNGDM